jgi:hypothetical protein
MNLPEDCRLTYTVVHEAWYWCVTHMDEEPQLNIHASSNGGGVAWEFNIAEAALPGRPLVMKLFSETWPAFAQMPEFFAGLAEMGDGASLVDVRDFLVELGADDVTERERVR